MTESVSADATERDATGVQCLAQLSRLRRRHIGDHLLLDALNGLAERIESALALLGEREQVLAVAVGVATPGDEPSPVEHGDHLGHRLGAYEGVARQLCRGKLRMPLQHR